MQDQEDEDQEPISSMSIGLNGSESTPGLRKENKELRAENERLRELVERIRGNRMKRDEREFDLVEAKKAVNNLLFTELPLTTTLNELEEIACEWVGTLRDIWDCKIDAVKSEKRLVHD